MIRFSASYDDAARSLSLDVSGHAQSDCYGHDTVCASASIITYTLAQIVSTMHRVGALEAEPVIMLAPGDARVSCVCCKEAYPEARSALLVSKVAYCLLAKNFPDYVGAKKA